jgi:hypothetical protein
MAPRILNLGIVYMFRRLYLQEQSPLHSAGGMDEPQSRSVHGGEYNSIFFPSFNEQKATP